MPRIIVTGSHVDAALDEDFVFEVLSELFEEFIDDELVLVYTKGNNPVAVCASKWASQLKKYGVRTEAVSSNQETVDRGAERVVAFYGTCDRGGAAEDCLRRAILAKIPVQQYTQV